MRSSNTFSSLDEAWLAVCDDVLQRGVPLLSRDGDCKELTGVSFRLSNINRTLLTIKERKLSPSYAAAELLWYMAGEKDVSRLLPYAPSYKRFVQPNTNDAHGAYGDRWFNDVSFVTERKRHPQPACKSQIVAACELLRKQPYTRQCVITMWQAGDLTCALSGEYKDLPCTMCLQLLRREGELHAIGTMRSNDVWLGLPYDVFAFTYVQRLIAFELGICTGTYTHQVGSMHVYDRDAPNVAQVCNRAVLNLNAGAIGKTRGFKTLQKAIELEEIMRSGAYIDQFWISREVGYGLEYDLVVACGRKLNKTNASFMSEPFNVIGRHA